MLPESRFWEAERWEPEASVLFQTEHRISAIAVNEAKSMLACVDERGTVIILDLRSNQMIGRHDQRPRRPGLAIAFSKNGRRLVVGGGRPGAAVRNGRNQCWLASFSVDSTEGLTLIDEHECEDPLPFSSLAFVNQNQIVATRGSHNGSSSVDGRVEFWHVSGKQLVQQESVWRGINARGIDVHADRNLIAWCDGLGLFYLYDLNSKRIAFRHRVSDQALNQARFSPSGKQIYLAGGDNMVSCWGLDIQQLNYVAAETSLPDDDDVSPPKSALDDASIDDAPAGPKRRILAEYDSGFFGHRRSSRDLVFLSYGAPDEDEEEDSDPTTRRRLLLASSGDDGSVRLWKDPLPDSIDRISIPRRRITDASWLPSGHVVFSIHAQPSRPNLLTKTQPFTKHGFEAEQRQIPRALSVAVPPDSFGAENPQTESLLDGRNPGTSSVPKNVY